MRGVVFTDRSGRTRRRCLEAGRRAAERSANIEAVAHLTRGIAALKILPETQDIAQLELGLQLALGPALMTTKGFGAQQAKSTYNRAWARTRSGAIPGMGRHRARLGAGSDRAG